MTDLSVLPGVNASLNAITTVLLVFGYFLARQRALTAHTMCMLAATLTSGLFLVSYLYYHFHHGSTKFQGQGPVRWLYFFILITHTILATLNAPLVVLTLWHAFRSNFVKHIRIARITLPIWLYVSVTGVIVYWMLYRVEYR